MDEVWAGIEVEFSDIPSLEALTRLVVRLLVGFVLGGVIGYERERRGKEAGLRTHMLVCLGAAFFVAVPERTELLRHDLSRIIQGVTAGIGFLGAGAIIKHEDASRVEGLTTAASLWFTAAVGIAVGLGRDVSAVIATILAVTVLAGLPRLERRMRGRGKTKP